jgi:prephenate dehydratase
MPSRALPRVGYLGPEGTFSEEALLASAAPGAVEPVPLATIYDAVVRLREGELEWAIVPIENSLDGPVSVTLDLLAQEHSGLVIVAEALLRIRHSLIASERVELADIETVLSHPQVPGQCERFLRSELAHAQIRPASSTAEAVRIIVEQGVRSQAALGTTLAAAIYGGTVIREAVQDSEDNETRFVWLARTEQRVQPPLNAVAGREWRTSLVFWGPGTERAGWLVHCLDQFARRNINMTKIESRPRRRGLGSYMFFADLAGRAEEPAIVEALAGLRSMCEQVRVLGSYRAAPEPPR